MQRQKIWVGVARDGVLLSLTAGRTRADTISHVIALASSSPDCVIGFDFSFGFPAWFVGDTHPWDLATECGSEWLASCPSPFWGRPGRPRVLDVEQELRRTELALRPRPGSVFQIGGAGSVGTASLRGMPLLRNLAAAGISVWPFAPWRLPVAAEVWPRSVIGSVVKSHRESRAGALPDTSDVYAPAVSSDDAFDACMTALALSLSSAAPPPVSLDAIDAIEGRILVR